MIDKDAVMQLRIPVALKQAFEAAADSRMESMSQALRTLIEAYVKGVAPVGTKRQSPEITTYVRTMSLAAGRKPPTS